MKKTPNIVVQLIHIKGPEPLNGKIHEFSQPVISIGRHPSCDLRFPKDLAIISREHARIVREGNRFKLVDNSTNGTTVKGEKYVKGEVYLQMGDVLTLADEDGPKISFLMEIREKEIEPAPAPRRVQPPPPRPEPPPPDDEDLSEATEPAFPPEPDESSPDDMERVKVPFTIQYGATLQSFKELPIKLGKSPACHFVLDHPEVYDQHAMFFFSRDNRYGVRDLTGKNIVSVNGEARGQAVLNANDTLALSPSGPFFQFIAGGRLAEKQPEPQEDPEETERNRAERDNGSSDRKSAPKEKSIFKKLFDR